MSGERPAAPGSHAAAAGDGGAGTGDRLDHLLVVSVEQAVAAPLCTRLLADAGARVIKVERPEGDFARRYDRYVDGESANFVWLNRGKESIALDLRDPADLALLRRMLRRADVFVQNLTPGALARLGLDPAALLAANPRLVVCSISGYGEEGPRARRKAYDLLVQAESGIAFVTGIGARATRVGVSVCDIAAGLNAYAGILHALLLRERTGRGRLVETSLFHAVGEWMNVPFLVHRHAGLTPPRLGLHHPTIAPYGAYRCGCGREILIAIQNEREWARFCADILGQPELARDPRFHDNPARVAHRDELDAVVAAVFARFDRETLAARLEEAAIAYGFLSTLEDLDRHPQNRYETVIGEGGGTIALLGRGYRLGGEPPARGRVPRLDEHGAAIRAEFAEDRNGEADP